MNEKEFAKEVEKLADKFLTEIDQEKLEEQLKEAIPQALKQAVLHRLGFRIDFWGKKIEWHDWHDGFINRLIKERVQEVATKLMDEVDLSAVKFSGADKKAVVSAFKKGRREAINKIAFEMGRKNAEDFVEKVVANVLTQKVDETKPDKEDKRRLLDAVFARCGNDDEAIEEDEE